MENQDLQQYTVTQCKMTTETEFDMAGMLQSMLSTLNLPQSATEEELNKLSEAYIKGFASTLPDLEPSHEFFKYMNIDNWNPLLQFWREWATQSGFFKPEGHGLEAIAMFPAIARRIVPQTHEIRQNLCNAFAWAVPTTDVLLKIVDTFPKIVEVGSGRGYWAHLLTRLGADVIAVDSHDYNNEVYHPTIIANGLDYFKDNNGCPDRALFLCWPHFQMTEVGDMIQEFKGPFIFHVGEHGGGCTFDIDAYFEKNEEIGKQWEMTETLRIPNWFGIRDEFNIYTRIGKTTL